jgi:hypothetical protein
MSSSGATVAGGVVHSPQRAGTGVGTLLRMRKSPFMDVLKYKVTIFSQGTGVFAVQEQCRSYMKIRGIVNDE